ncbi:U3 small nucleolar RNA-associated protein [Tulasnella sp. JGI-2019a]|nr:U3 small nucleolar RNA-associated protein [Tulasnella sp. JGI-2019a]KAG9028217.1 U3 small nucleolar RNA-associated protein [Tulasnella sp. JGI-2019a]
MAQEHSMEGLKSPSERNQSNGQSNSTPSSSRLKLKVHRNRLIEWAPGAITAIAFPPAPPPSPVRGKSDQITLNWFGTLAIGRANGNIELYEWSERPEEKTFAPQAWVLRKIFPGPVDSKVDSLAFAYRDPTRFFRPSPESQGRGRNTPAPTLMDLRMFSSGGGTDIIEWDLCSGLILRTYPVNGGSVWCLAVNPANMLLAAGCDDGGVQVFTLTSDTRGLEWHRRMDSGKGKVLSLAWGPPTIMNLSSTSRTAKPVATEEDTSDSESGSEVSSSSEQEEQPEWQDSWLVGGCSDSRLRRWDFASRRVVAQLLTDKLRGIHKTLVWAVGVLRNGTIVSGDSMGLVKFWDVKTSTQFKSVKAHEADVLCLAIGSDGSSIFSSGVDQKVTQCILSQTAVSEDGIPSTEWIKAFSKRLHAHDVRALAIWPPYSPFPHHQHQTKNQIMINPGIAPLLASGGQDMIAGLTPCSTPSGASSIKQRVTNPLAISAREAHTRTTVFEEGVWQRMAYPLANEVVWVATKADDGMRRLIVGRSDTGVKVWALRGAGARGGRDGREVDEGPESVLQMELNVGTNLVCGALSEDGRWLAMSDGVETKLFRLSDLSEDGAFKHAPRRIKSVAAKILSALPTSSTHKPAPHPSAAASKLMFTPDSMRLVIACAPSAHIVVFDLNNEDDVRVLRVFDQHADDDTGRTVKGIRGTRTFEESDVRGIRSSAARVLAMSVSHDGQWLASSDERGRVHVFNLDSMQHHTTLPTFPLPIQSMVFNPNPDNTSQLVLAQPNNVLSVFDVESRTFPKWAKALFGEQNRSSEAGAFKALKPGVEGLVFVKAPRLGAVENKGRNAKGRMPTGVHDDIRYHLLAWGWNWMCHINLEPSEGSTSTHATRLHDDDEQANQRNPQGHQPSTPTQPNFKTVMAYRQLLYVGDLHTGNSGEGEVLVVERPLTDILMSEGQPPPFYKPKYGRG